MSKENQLKEIHTSGKAYAIYKSINGFNLYTDFSKKITLNNKNVSGFLNKKRINKKPQETDLFIGFFGYELLNNLRLILIENPTLKFLINLKKKSKVVKLTKLRSAQNINSNLQLTH